EDEPACLDADDDVDLPCVPLGDVAHELAQRRAVGDERREVLEEDAGLGEVRDVTQLARDEVTDLAHAISWWWLERAVEADRAEGPLTRARRQRRDFGARLGWLRGPAWAYLCTGRGVPSGVTE